MVLLIKNCLVGALSVLSSEGGLDPIVASECVYIGGCLGARTSVDTVWLQSLVMLMGSTHQNTRQNQDI